MIGVTEMPGIDDFGPDETFTRPTRPRCELWARATGIGELSVWALQRDNGGCPGTRARAIAPAWPSRVVLQPRVRALDARVGPG